MGTVTVRERPTKEQLDRKRRNAAVLDSVDADNRRLVKQADRKQSDIVREAIDRYGTPLRAGDVATRGEKELVRDMRQWAIREGILPD